MSRNFSGLVLAGVPAMGGVGVVMITFIRELRAQGDPRREAILDGAVGRLRRP